MSVLILVAKSALATMLLVAGGAKLADLSAVLATVRMLVPRRIPQPILRGATLAVPLMELMLGTASLCSPGLTWINTAVFVLALGFVAVSVFGYMFHRGLSCTCFGALSGRTYDASGILRSVGIVALAAFAMSGVPHADITLGGGARALLLTAGLFIAAVSTAASRAITGGHGPQIRLAEQ